MKKIISMTICLLMVCVMIFTFTACGRIEAKKLVGTWEAEVDYAGAFNEGVESAGEDAEYLKLEKFMIPRTYIFNSDGTCVATVDEVKLADSVKDVKAQLRSGVLKMYKAQFDKMGVTISGDIETYLTSNNIDIDSLVEQMLPESAINSIVGEMKNQGNYEAKDGKLYISAGYEYRVDEKVYYTYTLNGDTLTLTAYVDESEDADQESVATENKAFPIVFTKAD